MPGRREREFDIPLPRPGHYLRMRFDFDDTGVSSFTAQYEMTMDGHTVPIVRYDTAHGQPHRDLLDRSGNTRLDGKEFLQMSNAQALSYAQEDIKANWQRYLDDFLRSAS